MSNWTINGDPADALPVDDRAVQYGDGLFETIAVRNGEPRFWELHAERLERGCERLGINTPDRLKLRDHLNATLRESGVDSTYAIAKIIVSSGQGARGYHRPDSQSPTTIIGAFVSRPWPVGAYQRGVEVRFCETRMALQPQLAGIKTLNRLEQVLAQSEWSDRSISEGLMLDTEERLICGTMSNLFLCIGTTVVTPAITRCGVSGVMRRKVIELLEANSIDYEVRDIKADELDKADGAFLSNSQFGVLPIRRCGVAEWQVNSVTSDIMSLVADAGVPECRL
jgi:4-amino-4-deoxychorismate lyase